MIEVKLFAGLRAGREKSYEFPANQFNKVAEIGEYLEIPREKMAIILVNGLQSDLEATFEDGDVISIFPAVGGGV
jgi:molybdopterin converting factor small subunit